MNLPVKSQLSITKFMDHSKDVRETRGWVGGKRTLHRRSKHIEIKKIQEHNTFYGQWRQRQTSTIIKNVMKQYSETIMASIILFLRPRRSYITYRLT
jgi:hypothetical protein